MEKLGKYRKPVIERYEAYKDMLCRCSDIMNNPEIIEYEIMDELDIDLYTYTDEKFLDILIENFMIYDEIKEKSLQLRKDFHEYRQNNELWNRKAFLNSEKWLSWYRKSGEIYNMLYY